MLVNSNFSKIDWIKINGMLPVIIQDYFTGVILMHGYMDNKALKKTIKNKVVTFYSRTKKRLWTKGEISGNYLNVVEYILDCDYDTLLILVNPKGDVCHLKTKSCFSNFRYLNFAFLFELEKIVQNRKKINDVKSYTCSLYNSGTQRIAQKVAEEAVEVALSATVNNKLELINEASDLVYHLLILLSDQNLNISKIIKNLEKRSMDSIKSN